MPRVSLPTKTFTRLLLAAVLVFAQHAALLHAYSHFGIVPDPYRSSDGHHAPTQGCELGVVHAALDGELPSSIAVIRTPLAVSLPAAIPIAGFTPQFLRAFLSRAPPARA
jgi:hypothetical protein